MSTEPFSPEHHADPADGTAPIAPVTDEMMDHAAHAAAEQADAVAREPAEALQDVVAEASSEAAPEIDHETPQPEPAMVEPAPESEPVVAAITTAANENAASDAVEAAASGALHAADLAFDHGVQASEGAARASLGAADSFGLLNAKVMEIAAANMSAVGDMMSALLGATSVPEAAAINADHMRRRLDALTTQGRELMLLAQKVAFDAMRPDHDGSGKP